MLSDWILHKVPFRIRVDVNLHISKIHSRRQEVDVLLRLRRIDYLWRLLGKEAL